MDIRILIVIGALYVVYVVFSNRASIKHLQGLAESDGKSLRDQIKDLQYQIDRLKMTDAELEAERKEIEGH